MSETWGDKFAKDFRARNLSCRWQGNSVFIYAVTEGPGLAVKLGASRNPKNRFQALQASTWRQLYLCWQAEGEPWHEAALKRLLAGRSLFGEWVSDPDDAIKTALPLHAGRTALDCFLNQMAEAAGHPEPYPPRKPRAPATAIILPYQHPPAYPPPRALSG
jgi:hypothetical protein